MIEIILKQEKVNSVACQTCLIWPRLKACPSQILAQLQRSGLKIAQVSDIIVAMLQAACFSPETHVKAAVKVTEMTEVSLKQSLINANSTVIYHITLRERQDKQYIRLVCSRRNIPL